MVRRKILIIGGAGFIGSHTANELHSLGHYVTILDSLNPKVHNGNFPDYISEGINKVLGSILDEELLLSLLKVNNCVYNFASELDLNPDYLKFINVNVGGTALIYELIRKYNLKIDKVVIASTQFVYGEGRYRNPLTGQEVYPLKRDIEDLQNCKWDVIDESGMKLEYLSNVENQPLNPPNHYAMSKYFQEKFAMTIGRLLDIPTVVLRYSIVHGPNQSIKNTYSGALRTFAIMIKNDLEIPTYEDNLSVRDFVSIKDVISANICVLEDRRANFEIFNVGGRKGYTVIDLARIVAKYFNKKLYFKNSIEFRLGDVRSSISSNIKLEQLGWTSVMSEEDAVIEYLNWFVLQDVDLFKFIETQKLMRENGSICKIVNC